MDLNSWKVSQRNIHWNFPNIISKIMQHNGLLAKHTIVYLFKINQRTRRASNELTSNKISNCEQISTLQTSSLLTEINAMSQTLFSKYNHIFLINFFGISVVLNIRKKTRLLRLPKKRSSVEKRQSLSERFEISEFRPPVHGVKFKFK